MSRATLYSASSRVSSRLASSQPKCSAQPVVSRENSCRDSRPSLSVSSFVSMAANVSIDGSALDAVDTRRVSPCAIGVPIAPFEARPIHQRGSPVASAKASRRVDPRTTSCGSRESPGGVKTIGVVHAVLASGRSRRQRWRPVARSTAIMKRPARLVADQDDEVAGDDRRARHAVEVHERPERRAPAFGAVGRVGDQADVGEEHDHALGVGGRRRRRRVVRLVDVRVARRRDAAAPALTAAAGIEGDGQELGAVAGR